MEIFLPFLSKPNPTVPTLGATPVEAFALTAPSGTTHVRLLITDNGFSTGSGGDRTGLGEIRFGGVAVPESSSTALLGLGGLALILRRRK